MEREKILDLNIILTLFTLILTMVNIKILYYFNIW